MSEDLPPATLLRRLRESDLLDPLADRLDRDPDELDELLESLGDQLEGRTTNSPSSQNPLTLYVDGASRHNPGPAGGGAVLFDAEGNRVAQASEYFGDGITNNAAEYRALLLGLDLVPPDTKTLRVKVDSQLMARQLNGDYRVKSDNLLPFYERAKEKLQQFNDASIEHIPREQNRDADALANRAIDQRG